MKPPLPPSGELCLSSKVTVALASLASIVTVAFVFTLKQSFKATAKVVMIARAKVKLNLKFK